MNLQKDILTGVPVVIAEGDSLSAAAEINGCGVVRIIMPAAWTAASLTFALSLDGVTYSDMYDAYGTEYAVTVAAAHTVVLTPSDFAGVRYIKVRSGTGATPVAQEAARTLTLVVRPL